MIELKLEDFITYTDYTWWVGESCIHVNIKSHLDVSEMVAVHNRILSSMKDENGEYCSERFEYIWRRSIIEAYSDVELPDDADVAYVICFSELWDGVCDAASADQIDSIFFSIQSKMQKDEQRMCASMHWKELIEDIQTISNAMLNFEHLPEWLADHDDKSTKPLLRKV